MQTIPAISRIFRSRLGLILAVCGVALVVVAGNWLGHTALFADATSAKPQSLSELYFADPNHLPASLQYGKSSRIGFAITNRTATRQTYTYDVVVQTDAAIARQAPVTITLDAGKVAQLHADVAGLVPHEASLVSITLEHSNQLIQFYAKP